MLATMIREYTCQREILSVNCAVRKTVTSALPFIGATAFVLCVIFIPQLLSTSLKSTSVIAPSPAATAIHDLQAVNLLTKVSDFYSTANSLNGTATLFAQTKNHSAILRETCSIIIQRPNQIHIRSLDVKGNGYAYISDGQHVLQRLEATDKTYSTCDAPTTLAQHIAIAGFGRPLTASFLLSTPYLAVCALSDKNIMSRIIRDATAVRYVGQQVLDGVSCDEVRLETDGFSFDIYIKAVEDPWVLRIVPHLWRAADDSIDGEVIASIETTKLDIRLAEWKRDIKLANNEFDTTPPEDAQKKDSFVSDFMKDWQITQRMASRLVGKRIPGAEQFGDELIDSRLANRLGKDVVVLEFWASWCVPCLRGLIMLERTEVKYASQGVSVFAVNIEESPATIDAYVAQHKLRIGNISDKNGRLAKLCEVKNVPRTVVIDQGGVIRMVKEGIMPDFEDEINECVSTLIRAGK